MASEYKNGSEVGELQLYGAAEVAVTTEEDKDQVEQIKDKFGTVFDDSIHISPTELTKTGRFKRLRTTKPKDEVKISADFILAISKEFGEGLANKDNFKIKTNKTVDEIFKRVLDEKLQGKDVAQYFEDKLPILILLIVPLYYIHQGARENIPLMEAVKANSIKVLALPYIKFKNFMKNRKERKKDKMKNKKESKGGIFKVVNE